MLMERKDDTVYIELDGPLSFGTVLSIKERIKEFLRRDDKKLILNLSKVEFVDSKGLEFIISIFERMKKNNGEFVVEYPQLGIQKLMEMARLDQMFEVIKTPEEKTGHWSEFE